MARLALSDQRTRVMCRAGVLLLAILGVLVPVTRQEELAQIEALILSAGAASALVEGDRDWVDSVAGPIVASVGAEYALVQTLSHALISAWSQRLRPAAKHSSSIGDVPIWAIEATSRSVD